ncbi:MAG: hypothetical protein R3B89_24725 [Polyangiaceae bacterium]
MRLAFAILGVTLTLGVMGGCSSSEPEHTPTGACGGSCTLESLCAVQPCGGVAANFDADGCGRSNCGSSDECPSGRVCFVPSLVESYHHPTGVFCEAQPDGSCACGGTVDGSGMGLCLPVSEIPEEKCVVPNDCESLANRIEELDLTDGWLSGDAEQLVKDCLPKMYARQQELRCPHTARACDGAFPCLLEELCKQQECGGATARFDANGCVRELCEESADCGANQVCFVPSLVKATCIPTGIEGCDAGYTSSCYCSQTADCSPAGLCIEQGELPTEACVVGSDCAALELQAESLGHSLVNAKTDLKLRLEQCGDRVREEQQALSCP